MVKSRVRSQEGVCWRHADTYSSVSGTYRLSGFCSYPQHIFFSLSHSLCTFGSLSLGLFLLMLCLAAHASDKKALVMCSCFGSVGIFSSDTVKPTLPSPLVCPSWCQDGSRCGQRIEQA